MLETRKVAVIVAVLVTELQIVQSWRQYKANRLQILEEEITLQAMPQIIKFDIYFLVSTIIMFSIRYNKLILCQQYESKIECRGFNLAEETFRNSGVSWHISVDVNCLH